MRKIFTSMLISVLAFSNLQAIAQLTIGGGNMITSTGGNLDLSLNAGSAYTVTGSTWELSGTAASLANTTTTSAKLNAKRNGTVTVTATVFNGTTSLTGVLPVTISNQIETLVLAGDPSITVSETNDILQLTVTGTGGASSFSQNVNWSISPSIGTIDGNAKFRASSNGVVTITAMSKADATVMSNAIIVSVSGFVALSDATITGSSTITINKGTSVLTLVSSPSNATNPKIAWSSTDDCIASVDGGTVSAKRNGVVTITGIVSNGAASVTKTYIVTISNQNYGFYESFALPYDGNPFGSLSGNAGSAYYVDNLNGGTSSDYRLSETTNGNMSIIVTSAPGLSGAIDVDNNFAPNAKYMGIGLTKGAGFPWNWGCGVDLSQSDKKVKMEVVNNSPQPITLYLGVGKEAFGDVFNGGGRFETYSVVLPANSTTMYVQTVQTNIAKYLKIGLGNLQTTTANVVFNYISVGQSPTTAVSLSASSTVLNNTQVVTISGMITPANAPMELSWMMYESSPGIATLSGTGFTTGELRALGTSNGLVTIVGTSVVDTDKSSMIVITITNQALDGITLTASSPSVLPNGVITVTSMGYPSDFANTPVEWSVEPSGLATISGTGELKAGSTLGVVTVTATSVANDAISSTIVIPISPVQNVSSGLESGIVLSPNPTTDVLNISAPGLQVLSYVVADLSGAVVSAGSSSTISLTGVASGTYIVTVQTSGGTVRGKVVKL